MGVANFGAGGARAFSSGFPGTLDEATVRGKILHPWEARDIMNFVEQHETENLADPRDCLQQIQGVGVMVLGGFDDAEFDITQQLIVGGDEREIHFDALLHCRIGKAFSDSCTIGFVGDFLGCFILQLTVSSTPLAVIEWPLYD